uniref:Protein kinase domain-containing protein n=1 Tax=Plectus sambesii TaxID=2011161 RepID=A0A914XMU8_9BILA
MVSDIFSSFDARPHGAASLAQVYKATLKSTGETVAVKVQHPRVKPHSVVDMATMEALVRIVAKIFPDFNLMWLVEETKKNLPRELDFLSEAKNAERVRRMFQHLEFLRVPKIHWEHCTDRVLVMEYCEGGQVNDLEYFRENRIDAHDVCRKLGKLYSEMIFVQGYVHCDPHPGNVLVNKKPNGSVELVLLDHGLYITLTDDFRLNYANLWLALLKPDQDAIKYWSKKMGVGDLYGLFACMVTARSWKSVTSGISKNVITADEACEIKRYAGSLLPQISDVLERMPRQMLLILKT